MPAAGGDAGDAGWLDGVLAAAAQIAAVGRAPVAVVAVAVREALDTTPCRGVAEWRGCDARGGADRSVDAACVLSAVDARIRP